MMIVHNDDQVQVPNGLWTAGVPIGSLEAVSLICFLFVTVVNSVTGKKLVIFFSYLDARFKCETRLNGQSLYLAQQNRRAADKGLR